MNEHFMQPKTLKLHKQFTGDEVQLSQQLGSHGRNLDRADCLVAIQKR